MSGSAARRSRERKVFFWRIVERLFWDDVQTSREIPYARKVGGLVKMIRAGSFVDGPNGKPRAAIDAALDGLRQIEELEAAERKGEDLVRRLAAFAAWGQIDIHYRL